MKHILTLVLLFSSVSCFADITLGAYKEISQDPEIKKQLDDYIIGTGRGIFWANVMLGVRGDKKLFCMPENLGLGSGLIKDLLAQEIKHPSEGTNYNDDTPIELMLTSAFMHKFPCRQ